MAITRQTVNFKKNQFEKTAWKAQSVVAGIDEVGRGCLAGPLVTAAIILKDGPISHKIKDSKLLSEPERIAAYQWILKHSWHGIGIVHNRIIDQHNIWQATLIAMKKALIGLLTAYPGKQPIQAILVDAMPLNLADTSYHKIPVHHFPFGEQRSSSIAAASIIAKVTRDRLMGRYDQLFPGYHLAQHKGYGTKKHKISICSTGHSIIHRISFLSNTFAMKDTDHENQQTIC